MVSVPLVEMAAAVLPSVSGVVLELTVAASLVPRMLTVSRCVVPSAADTVSVSV